MGNPIEVAVVVSGDVPAKEIIEFSQKVKELARETFSENFLLRTIILDEFENGGEYGVD